MYTNKGNTFNVNTLMLKISFQFHTQKDIKCIAYLQEMSELLREMSANKIHAVYGLSHVCFSEQLACMGIGCGILIWIYSGLLYFVCYDEN